MPLNFITKWENMDKKWLKSILIRTFRNWHSYQLLEHIHIHNFDNLYQSAYKADHSTETTLLSIKNEVHLSLSRGESTALILLDLSAAFDTTDHSTLLSCLQTWFGVGGTVLKWFTSYLTEHFKSIKIGSTLSDLRKLLFGIPKVLSWALCCSYCLLLPSVWLLVNTEE